MNGADLSGPTNGLIILSSASLAITQFFYSDLKTRFAAGKTVLEKLSAQIYLFNEVRRQRYDNLSTTKIKTVNLQMSFLFCMLFFYAIIKGADLWIDHLKINEWKSVILFSLAITTSVYTVLLGWTAISLKLIARKVKKFEDAIETLEEQARAASEALKNFRPYR